MKIWLSIAAAFTFCASLLAWLIRRAPLDESEPLPEYYIDSATLEELNRIRLRAFERTEQAEADAARCCELLGIDPAADSFQRDMADAIVFQRAHVVPTVTKIQQWRQVAHN